MNEQKQIGQLFGMMMQNMPEMTTEQRQRWIANPKGLQKFLSGLIEEKFVETLGHVIVTFKDSIDYNRSIADSIKAGKYDWVNEDITDKNFPSTEKGNEEIEYVLFAFDRSISPEKAIKEMKKVDSRPATMKELLSFGEKHPEIVVDSPFTTAHGSFARLGGGRYVGCLYWRGSKIHLNHVDYFASGSGGSCRFLAVKIR